MLVVVTAPTVEPVSLDEVKEHLRVTTFDQDNLIASYISAARESIELQTGKSLAAGTYRWVSESDIGYCNRLPLWPVATITEVSFLDVDDTRVILTDYIADNDRSSISFSTLPGGTALNVTFTTIATPIPPSLRAALFLLVTDLYEQGGAVITGVPVAINPTIDRLMQPHRANLGV